MTTYSIVGFTYCITILCCASYGVRSILFPVETESRQLIHLGDLWHFKLGVNETAELSAAWFNRSFKEIGDYLEMPVPASFNDIGMNATIRDHVGWVWYQRSWFASRAWSRDHNRVFIRFGSVHYWAKVWLNGVLLGEHKGGHLPFEFEITDHLVFNKPNLLTVSANNRLNATTLPQGKTIYPNSSLYPEGYSIYSHSCDYFDYSGINRPVYLYTTPRTYIQDIYFSADVIHVTQGRLVYDIITKGDIGQCSVQLYDEQGNLVAETSMCKGVLRVDNVHPWWPRGMSKPTVGYLYTLQIQVGPKSEPDIFRQTVGFRTISWNNEGVQINGHPLYIHGFGMHEDSNIKGRGFDSAVLMRDINLLQWVGANAIRTSHYPYAEETIAALERHGILVIVETPGCSIGSYNDQLLREHKRILDKMIGTHRTRANVIMWSIANEPTNTTRPDAVNYFKELAFHVKELDPTRPSILITGEFAHRNASTSAVSFRDNVILKKVFVYKS
uniref:Beta-glucuronidase n=2 Tax=Cacopsylla melanoneura TaxID=428564 RepID=A0A8D8LEE9_9HEMI